MNLDDFYASLQGAFALTFGRGAHETAPDTLERWLGRVER
jgi:hypothetical protein